MFNQLPTPVIIAHRGASAHAPENTIAAFRLAVEQRADAIELDAKLASDGHVVVIHDQTVDRTTTASGRVSQMTTYDLTKLDAGSHFDCIFKGEPIPTLEQVFDLFGKHIYINVELTNYESRMDDLPEKVAQLVNDYHLHERILFSSFNPIALIRIRRLLPEVPIGLLAHSGHMGLWARSWLGRMMQYHSLNPEFQDVNRNLIETAHKHNRRVYVYTVNERKEMERLFALKADGIFTDDPQIARELLSKVRN